MIKRRFIGKIVGNNRAVIERDEYHHLVHVHRAVKGEKFVLITREGEVYMAEILNIDKRKRMVLARLEDMLENNYISDRTGVYLAFALFNENRLRFLLEKATEIGVDGFLPFVSERSKRRFFEVKEGWYKVIEQAVKQSKRSSFPEFLGVMTFKEAVERARNVGDIYLFDIEGGEIDSVMIGKRPSFVFIGPEGGFTEEEKKVLKEYAKGVISLGHNVLRTETAAIIGSYEIIKAKNKRR